MFVLRAVGAGALVLAGLIGAGIIFMGTSAFWAPQAAVGFGTPDTRLARLGLLSREPQVPSDGY
jgi:hypothetical protein